MPKLTDAAIVAAIMETGSVTRAAEKLGVSRRTISGRIAMPECKRLLSEASMAGISEASNLMCSRLRDCVAFVYNLIGNEDMPPHIRLNAAQTLLQYALRFAETSEIISRLEQLEQREGISNEKHS